MKKIILFIFVSTILSLSVGCGPDGKCNGGTALCRPQKNIEEAAAREAERKEKEKKSKKEDDSSQEASGYAVIGQSLLSYPNLDAVEDDFDEAMFALNLGREEKLSLPIYKIEADHETLDKLLKQLKQNRGATIDSDVDGNKEIYTISNVKIKVNKETGRLKYIDLDTADKGADVDQLDKSLMLTKAEEVFKKYIPEELLKNTYFYRYAEFTNSSALRDGDVTTKPYAAGIALNPVVEEMPIIGSGGKYSVHVESDGTVSSFDFQLSKFEKTEYTVDILDSSVAVEKLKKKMAADGISLDDHQIHSSKLGYYFLSKRGKVKWLVPSFSFDVVPKEGVKDFGRMYTFPASDATIAQQLFDEDIDSEGMRKAAKLDSKEVVTEKK